VETGSIGRDILQAGGLLHDVLAGEIVAALLENLHHRLRLNIAMDIVGVRLVAVGNLIVARRQL
jgi:hypothetical protein